MDWIILSIQASSFYGFHIKTVRSPIENRTFSIWKPYGFDMETIKRRQLETDTEPFNHTLTRICQANLSEKLRSCFEFLQKSFSWLDVSVFVCALGDFLVLSAPVLRQIARYLPHHRSGNATKTHPKSSHDKFKTASKTVFIEKLVCENGMEHRGTNCPLSILLCLCVQWNESCGISVFHFGLTINNSKIGKTLPRNREILLAGYKILANFVLQE